MKLTVSEPGTLLSRLFEADITPEQFDHIKRVVAGEDAVVNVQEEIRALADRMDGDLTEQVLRFTVPPGTVSFHLRIDHADPSAGRDGGHVHVTFFLGKDADHRQHCGTIVFSIDQWHWFRARFPDAEVTDEERVPAPSWAP